jgi:AcrR family transcriptional regulator
VLCTDWYIRSLSRRRLRAPWTGKSVIGVAVEPALHEVDVESTRDRILRVAAEKFARKGYHATGVAELGDAAGIKRGALYYHIGSKEDLLYQLSRRHVEEALSRGQVVVAEADGAVEKFRLLVREHLRTLAARRDEVIVVMHEMYALTGDRAKELNLLRSQYEQLFAAVLREGVAEGVFRSAERIEVLGVLSMLNYTYVWLDPNGPISVDEIAGRLSDLILYGAHVQTAGRPVTPRISSDRKGRRGARG